MYYDDDVIEQVRSRNDIVDVISSYVKLKRSGSTYFGLCPFHSEKTPSFSVTPRKQMFYCFGCHATGDAIDFVSELFQISKLDAAKQIAEDFHLDYDSNAKANRKKPMTSEQKKELEMRQLQRDFREWQSKVLSDLNGDYRLLNEKAEAFRPTDKDAPFSHRFVEAVKDKDTVLFYIESLENAPKDVQIKMYLDEKNTIEKLHRKIAYGAEMRSSVRTKLKEKMKQLQSSANGHTAAERHKAVAL